MKIEKKRYTIAIPVKIIDVMEDLGNKEGISKAEVIRRALALYDYVHKEVIEKNNRSLVIYENDKIIKELVLTIN